MKKRTSFTTYVIKLALMMLLFLAFAACQKDGVTSTDTARPEGETVPLAIQGGNLGSGGRDGCSCEYQIVSVSPGTAPTGKHFEYIVYSEDACVSNTSCYKFSFLESTTACENYFSPGACYDLGQAIVTKPTGWYPFSCEVDLYSQLTLAVAQGVWMSNTACAFNSWPTGSVTVKLRCSDPNPPYCGLGYTFVSKEFEIPFTDGESSDGQKVAVELSGCGCQLPTE